MTWWSYLRTALLQFEKTFHLYTRGYDPKGKNTYGWVEARIWTQREFQMNCHRSKVKCFDFVLQIPRVRKHGEKFKNHQIPDSNVSLSGPSRNNVARQHQKLGSFLAFSSFFTPKPQKSRCKEQHQWPSKRWGSEPRQGQWGRTGLQRGRSELFCFGGDSYDNCRVDGILSIFTQCLLK